MCPANWTVLWDAGGAAAGLVSSGVVGTAFPGKGVCPAVPLLDVLGKGVRPAFLLLLGKGVCGSGDVTGAGGGGDATSGDFANVTPLLAAGVVGGAKPTFLGGCCAGGDDAVGGSVAKEGGLLALVSLAVGAGAAAGVGC